MTQPVERRADEAASGWEEHSRRHSPRRLGRPVANAKPGSILRIEGSTTHTDVLLTRRGGQSCLRTGGIWEISDEVPAQPAARPSGSLSGVVCQPGLHVGALVWLGRWAVARCDGARDAGARRARMDPAATRDRRICLRRCIRLVARPPAMVAADIGARRVRADRDTRHFRASLSRSERALPSGKPRTNISAQC